MIPLIFTEKLIELGKLPNIESPKVAIRFQVLKPYERYMVGTWNDWYPLCESLSVGDHIALFKALVLTEKHVQIGGTDSASSGI